MDERLVERAVEALRAGDPVVLPTDTVYGLCSLASDAEAVERLSRLKRRSADQPIALAAAAVDALVACVPELRGRAETMMRALLPGPLTLVLPNPAGRLAWLGGPGTIGVRVPELGGEARAIVAAVGAVAATSANVTGGPDPRRVAEVPAEIRDACAAIVDGGELPGTPSTVVDLTGAQPKVLRDGAVPAADVERRLGALGDPRRPAE